MNAIPDTRSGNDEGALGRERHPRAHGAAATSSPSAPRGFIAESAAPTHSRRTDLRESGTLPLDPSAVNARTEPVLLSEMDRTGTAPPQLAVARTLRRDPCENSISEAELLRAYEGAAPWSPEMR